MRVDWTGVRSSDSSDLTYCSLAVTSIMARYSASREHRVIMCCFVDLQEIELAPKKMRKAPMEVRLSRSPA